MYSLFSLLFYYKFGVIEQVNCSGFPIIYLFEECICY